MRRLLGFLVVIVVLLMAVSWYLGSQQANRNSVRHDVREGAAKVKEGARAIGHKLPDIDTGHIREELARTGRVVRRKAQEMGAKLADATADARTTAAIKGQFALDPELSAWDISVDTTGGRVTLAGKVSSPEHIDKAMRLALAHDRVDEVISTLQIDPKARPGDRPPVASRRRSEGSRTE